MISVVVNVTGLTETQTKLARLSTSLHDFTGALTSLGTQLVTFYSQTVFSSRGQALGETWAPLAASTRKEKDRNWRGRPDLVRTGLMQESFYKKVTPDTLFIGNKAPYFAYQQLGTSRNLPARKMLGVNATVEGFIRTTIEEDIRAKIDGLA